MITKRLLLTTADVPPSREDFSVIGVFNPGVTRVEGETVLLLRVAERPHESEGVVRVPLLNKETGKIECLELSRDDKQYDFSDPRIIGHSARNYITSMSHFRLARSKDGINFHVETTPVLAAGNGYESYGIEDARITQIGDEYYLAYSSASEYGVVNSLAATRDFKRFEKKGLIFSPDNKDVAIFPEKIGGKYYALHRPSTSEYGRPEMWLAESDNLLYWGNHRHLASVRPGRFDSGRLGASCVPFLTEAGWVEIYHGATKENRYCLGALLLDRNDPSRVLKRSELPLVEPAESYECEGFFRDVVFSCGCLVDGERVRVYYGAADTSVALAEMTLDDIYENLGL